MALTALPPPDLGGLPASWLWRSDDGQATREQVPGRIPAGLAIDHGHHELLIIWAPLGELLVTFGLDGLLPLTIVEPILCPACAQQGRITGGVWHPIHSSSKGATA